MSTPRMDLRFPGVLIDPYTVRRATLIQKTNTHDILRLKVTGSNYAVLADGAPVTFRWSSGRGAGIFHGYVHRVDPSFKVGSDPSEIVCVGITYPLMATGNDVWVGVRASDVVRDIARRFRLSFDIEEHPRVYEQVSQAGESYWQLLVRLAKETGMVLHVEGAVIYFRSRRSFTMGNRPHATRMRFHRDVTNREIHSFIPQVGSYTPETGAQQNGLTSGVDAVSGAILSTTSTAPGLRFGGANLHGHQTNTVARNYREAHTAAEAAQETSRFTRTAKMESVGDPRIKPESFVDVTGVDPDMSGTWSVREVTHTITGKNYTCNAVLGTDGLGNVRSLPGESATLGDEVNPHRPGAVPRPLNPVLVDQRTLTGSGGGPGRGVFWSSPVVNWSI